MWARVFNSEKGNRFVAILSERGFYATDEYFYEAETLPTGHGEDEDEEDVDGVVVGEANSLHRQSEPLSHGGRWGGSVKRPRRRQTNWLESHQRWRRRRRPSTLRSSPTPMGNKRLPPAVPLAGEATK